MAPDMTIVVKSLTGQRVEIAITLIYEKLFAVFNGFARLTKAVEAISGSISMSLSNAPARKDAKEATA